MGIRDLNVLLRRYAPQCITEVPLNTFANKGVACDVMILFHAAWAISLRDTLGPQNEPESSNSDCKTSCDFAARVPVDSISMQSTDNESFLADLAARLARCATESVLRTLCRLAGENIVPLCVFDGEHPPEKELYERKRRLARAASSKIVGPKIDKFAVSHLKNAVSAAGFDFLEARGEAEELCAALCREEIVSAVFTTDTDALAWRAPTVITKIGKTASFSEKTGKFVSTVTTFDYGRVLSGLAMSPDQFTDLCILCGCDFNDTIPKVGYVRALKLMRQYDTISQFPPEIDISPLNYKSCCRIFDATISACDLVQMGAGLHNSIFTDFMQSLASSNANPTSHAVCSNSEISLPSADFMQVILSQ